MFAIILQPGFRSGGIDMGRTILTMKRAAPKIRHRAIGTRHHLVVSTGGMTLGESRHTVRERYGLGSHRFSLLDFRYTGITPVMGTDRSV